jgi:hypothetical protein
VSQNRTDKDSSTPAGTPPARGGSRPPGECRALQQGADALAEIPDGFPELVERYQRALQRLTPQQRRAAAAFVPTPATRLWATLFSTIGADLLQALGNPKTEGQAVTAVLHRQLVVLELLAVQFDAELGAAVQNGITTDAKRLEPLLRMRQRLAASIESLCRTLTAVRQPGGLAVNLRGRYQQVVVRTDSEKEQL